MDASSSNFGAVTKGGSSSKLPRRQERATSTLSRIASPNCPVTTTCCLALGNLTAYMVSTLPANPCTTPTPLQSSLFLFSPKMSSMRSLVMTSRLFALATFLQTFAMFLCRLRTPGSRDLVTNASIAEPSNSARPYAPFSLTCCGTKCTLAISAFSYRLYPATSII